MTTGGNASVEPTLDVDDNVLARIAAFEAAQTPGVARLHPYVVQAARNVVNSAAKRAAAKLTSSEPEGHTTPATDAADPAAVDVDVEDDSGALTLTIRIVASTQPPILTVIRELQQRINSRITEITGTVPVVIINVLDVDPPDFV